LGHAILIVMKTILSLSLFFVVGIVLGMTASQYKVVSRDFKAEAQPQDLSYHFKETDLPYLSDNEVTNIRNELTVRLQHENRFDSVQYFQVKKKFAKTREGRTYCQDQLNHLTRKAM
jgi:preprotein translocase subunit SecF